MTKKSFYYIKSDKSHVTLTLDMLDSGPLPIMWDYQGLHGVMQKEGVENIISILNDIAADATRACGVPSAFHKIWWDHLRTDSYTILNCLTF